MRIALLAISDHDETLHEAARLASRLAQVAETHLFVPAHAERELGGDARVTCHPLSPWRTDAATWRKWLAMGNPWLHADHAKRIRRVDPDVVHLLHPHATHALMIPLLGRPTCLSLHGAELPSALGEPSRREDSRWEHSHWAHSHRESSLREFLITRSLLMVDQLICRDPRGTDVLRERGFPAERLAHATIVEDPLALLAVYRQLLARLRANAGHPLQSA